MVFTSDHTNPPKDGTPRDLAINQFQDIFFAADGDLAVVNGRTNIKQSAAIDVLHITTPSIGGTVKPTTVYQVQSEIRNILEQDPQIERIVSVEPVSYDTENGELKFGVKTVADDDYTIPVQSIEQTYTHSSDVSEENSVKYAVEDEKTY